MLDGGAAPPAPPGKANESPPSPEEFSNTLQQAQKGDETPGEVAETEPNAQLQKLDSKGKEAGNTIPVTVLIGQAVNVPLQVMTAQAVVAPAIVMPGDKVTEPVGKSGKSGASGSDKQSLSKAELEDDAVDDQLKSQSFGSDVTINDLVAALSQMKLSPAASQAMTVQAAASKGPSVPLQPVASKNPADQSEAKQIADDLNVTSVQSKTIALPTASASSSLKPVVNDKGEFGKHLEAVADGKNAISIHGPTAKANSDSGLSGDTGHKSDSNSQETDEKSNDIASSIAPSASTSDAKPTAFTTVNAKDATSGATAHSLTTSDRQKVVDTLTQRIEELSVRSVRSEVRVEMQPPELGSVVVNLRRGVEGLSATLTASNEPLRQALHESRNDLAGTLADRNVGQVHIEVRSASADTMNMGQQFSQSNSQQQQAAQQQAKQAPQQFTHVVKGERIPSNEVQVKPLTKSSTNLLDMEI